jgi:hypothetical protein
MSRNHQHLGLEALIKTPLPRSNGKTKILTTHRHTPNGMVPRTVSKITQGETTAILDGVEHRMVQSASLELVDASILVVLMHNELIFPSVQRRALDFHNHITKTERVALRLSHGRS